MLLTVLLNIVLTATSFYGEPAGFVRGNHRNLDALQPEPHLLDGMHCGQPPAPTRSPSLPVAAQEVANTVFSACVLLEFGVKLAAMGPRLYWRSNWHKVRGRGMGVHAGVEGEAPGRQHGCRLPRRSARQPTRFP